MFERCSKDSLSIYNMRDYCEEIMDKILPFNVRITKIGDLFGTKNIYCKWKGNNLDLSRKLILNITKLNFDNNDKIYLEIYTNDGKNNFYEIISSNFQLTSLNVNYIILHFYMENPKLTLPIYANFEILSDYIEIFFLCI